MGLGPVENWTLEIFTDVAHGNLNNKVDSTDSQVLLVRNEEGLCAPIMWQAHKLKRVVTSSIEAETLTLLEDIIHTVNLRQRGEMREMFCQWIKARKNLGTD